MAIMETKNASTGIDEMQTKRGITMSGGDKPPRYLNTIEVPLKRG